MKFLEEYFINNKQNLINKWLHYFDIYEKYFSRYKGKEIVILEIGVYQGGSLKMWRNYFGERAKIFAIDINPLCKQFEDTNTNIFIGSQSDIEFLEKIKAEIPKIDILIDDGGHFMNQQITSFEILFDHMNEDAVYLCEDTHTSYWNNYGGGYRNEKSFIEYSKTLIDQIHAWYSQTEDLQITSLTKSIHSISYFDSIVVIEKKKKEPPVSKIIGVPVIDEKEFDYDFVTSNTNEIKSTNNVIIKLLRMLFK
jgi:hypothetical protein